MFSQLYEYADRKPPGYFPEERLAEVIHDHGRRMWQQAYETGVLKIREQNGVLLADFTENLDQYTVYKYERVVPSMIRTEQQRTRIQFEQPERFYEWTKIERTQPGLFDRIRRMGA